MSPQLEPGCGAQEVCEVREAFAFSPFPGATAMFLSPVGASELCHGASLPLVFSLLAN